MRYIILLFVGLSGFAQQPMKDAEIRAFQEGVRTLAAQTETLSASFHQLRHSKYLAKAAESSGSLRFQKPGSVLWKYTAPDTYTVLFRDNKMYVQEKGRQKDVNAGKRLEKLNALIRGSVTGDLFDAPEFSFSYEKQDRKILVRMVTREAALKRYIREIELTFEDNFSVSQMIMREPSNDFTLITLKNRVINGRLPANTFDL